MLQRHFEEAKEKDAGETKYGETSPPSRSYMRLNAAAHNSPPANDGSVIEDINSRSTVIEKKR